MRESDNPLIPVENLHKVLTTEQVETHTLAGRPSVLLADEPTGNLDSSKGEAVMGLVSELHRGGATICMVTHDPRYACHADRTIQLFDGRIVKEKEAACKQQETAKPQSSNVRVQ